MAPKKSTAAASSSAASKPKANTASKRKAPAKVSSLPLGIFFINADKSLQAAPDGGVTSTTATRKSSRPTKTSTAPAPTKVTKAKKAPATKAAPAGKIKPSPSENCRTKTSVASKKAPVAKKAPSKTTASAPKKPNTKAATTTKANASRKRKTEETEDEEEKETTRAAKRARTPQAKAPKVKAVINQAPTEKLNVYVFGEGSAGELGLGTAKTAIDVKRPRLNPLLPAADVGVVQVSCGGMHVIALTHDNKILTWGCER